MKTVFVSAVVKAFQALTIAVLLFVVIGHLTKVAGSREDSPFFKLVSGMANFITQAQNVYLDYTLDPYWASKVPAWPVDRTGFTSVENATDIPVKGLLLRKGPAFASAPKTWRVIAGMFLVGDEYAYLAIRLDPELRINRIWRLAVLDEVFEDYYSGAAPFLHGVEWLPDNSVIYSFDEYPVAGRVSECGNHLWRVNHSFHHAINRDEDTGLGWTLYLEGLGQFEPGTGRLSRTIPIRDIVAANPENSVLEGRLKMLDMPLSNTSDFPDQWLYDPYHLNDADPLPARLADKFPMFEPGDLLVSFRSLSTVIVLDPDTLEIKWHYLGRIRRQHDPDWNDDGTISILDNRLGGPYSRILSIDPASHETRILFDGGKQDFFTRIRGKHQITPSGGALVTSTQQGRFFEVDKDGQLVFDLINTDTHDPKWNLAVSDAFMLDEELVNPVKETKCSAS